MSIATLVAIGIVVWTLVAGSTIWLAGIASAAAPAATADIYDVEEDGVLTVSAPGVLGNDADGATSQVVDEEHTAGHGTVSMLPDGSFTYTPEADYSGTDSFTYRISNGIENSGVVAVTINVEPVNDAPVANNDGYTTAQNTELVVDAPGVLGNDADIDTETITARVETTPAHGTVVMQSSGAFTYTPLTGYHGNDSFTYTAYDGTAYSNVARVNISVNSPPVAADDAFTVNEDEVLSASPGILANDHDADSDTLVIQLGQDVSHGTLALNSDGTFTYTPAPNFYGTDTFKYNISDGYASTVLRNVTITVEAVNDVPTAADDRYRTDVNTLRTVSFGGVLSNDADIESTSLTAVLVADVAHGTLVLNTDGTFTYTPDTDYRGTDSFTYRASDGTATSNLATVSIVVNNIPVAGDDTYNVEEDTQLTVTATDGLLFNDYDDNADTIRIVTETHAAGHGTVSVMPDGSFTYTPEADYSGTDHFIYSITDGLESSATAIVTITVGAVNDAPVAAADSYSVDEDTKLTIPAPGVLGNDADAEDDTLSAAVKKAPAHGSLILNQDGSLTYTPNSGYYGTDTFTYVANDGITDSNPATVTIKVNRVNHVPVAGYDTYNTPEDTTLTIAAPGLLANDNDPDGDALTAVLVTNPGSGTLTLSADGRFVYVPGRNYHGQDSFTYKAYDGVGYSDARTVTITVNSVNDIPYAGDDEYWVNEDNSLYIQAPGVLGNDADADGDALSAYLVSGTSHGSLTLYTNGSFSYQPSSNYYGQDSFTYKTGDGSANSTTATVRLNVNSVNDVISVSGISHTNFPPVVGEKVKISLSFNDIDQRDQRSARIFWGDGEMDWASINEKDGSGTITGEYAYSKPGNYTITVMIMDGYDGLITRDTGVFSVVSERAASPTPSPSPGAANPAESVPATVSPTPVETATPQATTTNPAPASGWLAWVALAALLGLAAAGVAGYLIFFKPKG